MNLQELSVQECEFRNYPCYKVYPRSGRWSKGGVPKNEVRNLLVSAGYQLTLDEPYLLNANEFFPELNPLESVVAFVFFKDDKTLKDNECGEYHGSGDYFLKEVSYTVSCMNCNGKGFVD